MQNDCELWPQPQTIPELAPDLIQVWSINPALVSPRHSTILSSEERQRAGQFRFDRDRNLFIASRHCVRVLAGALLGVLPENVEFVYGPQGKPELNPAVNVQDIRFNISHTNGMALVALTFGRVLGVDIERIDRSVNVIEIAERFFSKREFEVLSSMPEVERHLGFLRCWTRKEAFIKAMGGGLSIPLNKFHVSLNDQACLKEIEWSPGEASLWQMDSLNPADGFIAALAVKDLHYDLRCLKWNPQVQ